MHCFGWFSWQAHCLHALFWRRPLIRCTAIPPNSNIRLWFQVTEDARVVSQKSGRPRRLVSWDECGSCSSREYSSALAACHSLQSASARSGCTRCRIIAGPSSSLLPLPVAAPPAAPSLLQPLLAAHLCLSQLPAPPQQPVHSCHTQAVEAAPGHGQAHGRVVLPAGWES